MPQFAIVDDSVEDRFFLRRVLKKSFPQSKVVEFGYAVDAIAFLRSPARQTLDAIFVDINMPQMNGFEFADLYASLYPELTGDAEFYIVSHSIDPDHRIRANAHPAVTDYLEKPVDISQIMLAARTAAQP